MDEQFKNLKFDMDEEIEERRRTFKRRHGHRPMKISYAIILGAIIIGAGFFGGQVYLNHSKAPRIDNVVIDASKTPKSKRGVDDPRARELAEKLSGTGIVQSLNRLSPVMPQR
jgi:hypothetical protein